jgi:hypothetical protein
MRSFTEMKKKRIRSENCQNCGLSLKPEDNYCPVCGQENDNKRQPVFHILLDIFQNFLSLDSKVFGSLIPLVTRPGFLTLEFIRGRRARYLHPARLFLSLVVAYFLIASMTAESNSSEDGLSPIFGIDTTVYTPKITFEQEDNDGGLRFNTSVQDTSQSMIRIDSDQGQYAKVRALVNAGVTDVDAVIDSLGGEHTFGRKLLTGWLIKSVNLDQGSFKDYLLEKLPWIIFGFMPVFALLMKLFYFRHDKYYIDHLIFSFHLHSFVFLVFIIITLIMSMTGYNANTWAGLAILLYCLLSFRNVFRQKWIRTILKVVGISFFYSLSIMIGGMIYLGVAYTLF